jgi:hypothetical protein
MWTDNIVTPDWRKMNEACSENLCFRYFKHCSSSDQETVCYYQFGHPGDEEAVTLRVVASAAEGIIRAEASISVLNDPESRALRLPLNSLHVTSDAPTAPICPRKDLPCIP